MALFVCQSEAQSLAASLNVCAWFRHRLLRPHLCCPCFLCPPFKTFKGFLFFKKRHKNATVLMSMLSLKQTVMCIAPSYSS
uniref:Uncharacterized protein n=1 Tax=Anguilla anguilla TaxID=7936 RepID=A0A0E9WH14_ANGAN